MAFALLHSQNKITSKDGTNHWIPFTEKEINARDKFESNFMTQFIKGKIKSNDDVNLFAVSEPTAHYEVPLKFSTEATAVFDAGRALWAYYHAQQFLAYEGVTIATGGYNVNASLYDIREHFQGRGSSGRMNNKSKDETYTGLIEALRETLKQLALAIEPKVYEYEFLKL